VKLCALLYPTVDLADELFVSCGAASEVHQAMSGR
jgi:hypothetical protein